MRYTVWQRGLATSHTAPFFSTATAFHILLSAVHTPFLIQTSLFLFVSNCYPQVVIIAPLLVAYRSQGFWMRSASYQEQAELPEELRLSSLLSSYSARNLSLRLENEYKVTFIIFSF